MELVIMAAGLGTRFGGLKQLEPIDQKGNFIIDYSINNAIRCGFKKVIFVIKKENFNLFKNSIGKRVEQQIKVQYVFQNDTNFLPIEIPQKRTLPLGTGHAIFCVKDVVKSPFVVINADDFYGYDAFCNATKFIKHNKQKNLFAIVGYKIKNTIYQNKKFNRGICYFNKKRYLQKIVECCVQQTKKKIVAKNKLSNEVFYLKLNHIVSMNMFVFNPNIFKHIEKHFQMFLKNNKNFLLTAEYELPSLVTYLIKNNIAKFKVLKTNAKWFGLTYKEDKIYFQKILKKLK